MGVPKVITGFECIHHPSNPLLHFLKKPVRYSDQTSDISGSMLCCYAALLLFQELTGAWIRGKISAFRSFLSQVRQALNGLSAFDSWILIVSALNLSERLWRHHKVLPPTVPRGQFFWNPAKYRYISVRTSTIHPLNQLTNRHHLAAKHVKMMSVPCGGFPRSQAPRDMWVVLATKRRFHRRGCGRTNLPTGQVASAGAVAAVIG